MNLLTLIISFRLKLNVHCASKRSDRSSTLARRTATTRSTKSLLLHRLHRRTIPVRVPDPPEEEQPGQYRKCTTDWISLYPSRHGSLTVQRSTSSRVKVNGCGSCSCTSLAMCNDSAESFRTIPFHRGKMDPNGGVTFTTDGCTRDRWPTSVAG